jgi:hypothetical protein
VRVSSLLVENASVPLKDVMRGRGRSESVTSMSMLASADFLSTLEEVG